MEREREGAPRARRLQRAHELLRGLLHAVRVVLTEVRVSVKQLEPRSLLEDDLGPRSQRFEQIHAGHSYHEMPCPGP